MARGRMISQGIALDPEFNQLSERAQLMFMRTVPYLDRDGLVLGNPTALWAKVAPLQPAIQPDMPNLVDEWIQAGLVVRYGDKGRDVLWFKGFRKNQVGMRYDREPPTEFGIPPGYIRGDDDFVPAKDETISRQPSGNLPANGRIDAGEKPLARSRARPEVEIKLNQSSAPAADDRQGEGQDLVALLRSYGFVYLDRDAIAVGTQLVDHFGWEHCAEKVPKLKAAHDKMVKDGKRGIMAPVSYLRTILEEDETTADASNAGFVENSWAQLNTAVDYGDDENG